METVIVQTAAEKYYKQHLKNSLAWQKRNKDSCNAKQRKYNTNLKENHPEKYEEMLAKKRQYYIDVVKPKKEALVTTTS